MTDHWRTLTPIDGKIFVKDGSTIRRTYTVGQPGETVELLIRGTER